MYSAISQLALQVGTQGNGSSASSPLKFVILITDGLSSDRSGNWNCAYWGYDSYWSWQNTCFNSSPYPTTIDSGECQQIKNSGIILAILETPYVPLTGESPNVQPYEDTVRHGRPEHRERRQRGTVELRIDGLLFPGLQLLRHRDGIYHADRQVHL